MKLDGQNDIACPDISTKCIKLVELQLLVETPIRHHYLSKGLKQISINLLPQQKSSKNYKFFETSSITYCKKRKRRCKKKFQFL